MSQDEGLGGGDQWQVEGKRVAPGLGQIFPVNESGQSQEEAHQLGANLEDAVDVLPVPASFGPTLGEAGEQAEQSGHGGQGELGGQGGEKVFLELGMARWAFFSQLL